MTRPQILLIPEFTELEWAIKPGLEEWAEVASYDPPGVGGEPPAETLDRDAVAQRGLEELNRWGWKRCVLASDGWGIATAVKLALARPRAVAGLALGHTKLSYRREGERAPVNAAVWAGMREPIGKDHEAFVRYGAAQVTGGSIDEELAEQMIERFRPNCSLSTRGTRSRETTLTSESFSAASTARCCSPSTWGV